LASETRKVSAIARMIASASSRLCSLSQPAACRGTRCDLVGARGGVYVRWIFIRRRSAQWLAISGRHT
jgi:hypothetical protein